MLKHMNARLISAGLLAASLTAASLGCGVDPAGAPGQIPVTPSPTLPTTPTVSDELTERVSRPDGPFTAAPARVRRLLRPQYENAVRDLLGTAAAEQAAAPVDLPLNGFLSVGAGEIALSGEGVDTYESSAEAVAFAASRDPSSPARSVCTETTAACYGDIIDRLGRRAFRRSLTEEERSAYVGLAVAAVDAYGPVISDPRPSALFEKGLEFLLMGLIQSPHFLYIVELGESDDPADARRLTGNELATRLSFFILNSPPTDALLDAAERGDLESPTVREAMVRELLAHPRARQTLRSHFAERLQIEALSTLNRPELSESVRAAMVEETLRLVDDVVWDRNADVRELFMSKDTFVNDELAAHYGFDLPGSGALFSRVPTPSTEGRAGILTRGAFLTRFAHPNRSSPTLRGKFIRENLLCVAVSAPPDDVVTTLPETVEDNIPRTTRDRMAAHVVEPRCAACHSSMDPLGFSLEHFDQYGRYRSHENGLPVDATAEIDGQFADGSEEFMAQLSRRSDMASCLVRSLYRQGAGAIETAGQEGDLYDVDTDFIDAGLRLQEALVAVAMSDAFSFVALDVTANADAQDGE